MNRFTKFSSVFILLLACAISVIAQTPANNIKLVIEGKVNRVHDADTFTVLDGTGKGSVQRHLVCGFNHFEALP